MEYNNINTEEINQIDMSINSAYLDNDDDSFGSIVITDSTADESNTDRNYNKNTGIIIDLSDDDISPEKSLRKITADIDNNSINIRRNFESQSMNEPAFYNDIDLETDYFDDEDEELVAKLKQKSNPKLSTKSTSIDNNYGLYNTRDKKFYDIIDGELILVQDSSMRYAKKSDAYKALADIISFYEEQGKDFDTTFISICMPSAEQEALSEANKTKTSSLKQSLKKMQKEHAKTIKKGAYNMHMHFSGNPEADKDAFNQAMSFNNTSGESAAVSGDMCGSIGENFNSNTVLNMIPRFFTLLGVDVFLNSDNSFTVVDTNSRNQEEIICTTVEEFKETLQPFVEDIFIFPLQMLTDQKFDTCKEWCTWYNNLSAEEKEIYKNIETDINYCDLFVNHLNLATLKEVL